MGTEGKLTIGDNHDDPILTDPGYLAPKRKQLIPGYLAPEYI